MWNFGIFCLRQHPKWRNSMCTQLDSFTFGPQDLDGNSLLAILDFCLVNSTEFFQPQEKLMCLPCYLWERNCCSTAIGQKSCVDLPKFYPALVYQSFSRKGMFKLVTGKSPVEMMMAEHIVFLNRCSSSGLLAFDHLGCRFNNWLRKQKRKKNEAKLAIS